MEINQKIISVGAQAPIFFAPDVDCVDVKITSKNTFKANVYIGYSKPISYKKIRDKEGLVLLSGRAIDGDYIGEILAQPKYLFMNVSEITEPIEVVLITHKQNVEQKDMAA